MSACVVRGSSGRQLDTQVVGRATWVHPDYPAFFSMFSISKKGAVRHQLFLLVMWS